MDDPGFLTRHAHADQKDVGPEGGDLVLDRLGFGPAGVTSTK